MSVQKLQKTVLGWYKNNKRDLPWRKTKDPYEILVSEVMLQQTQVSRVLEKYPEFLKAFPTLKALARAPDRELLSVWKGLGYWKRALNLKETARIIQQEHKGRFPKDPRELEKLPGVGPYTARAVACFAFLNPEAFIDTNIRRVYLHFFFKDKAEVSDKDILTIAQKVVWREDPREWHYALFDYGAVELKDKKVNRQSRHYAKQSRFEGSFRSFRTSIVKMLLEKEGVEKKVLRSFLDQQLHKQKAPWEADDIIESLVQDGLIAESLHSYLIQD
ncbi:MAG: A/G-specific adenine glycosylase [bacterium]|nr:A/G-specific adenine glycosylase [bacterium]